ncbi:MAG TPA: SIMPL domain-containing protein [Tepidisphaeraceae bacterium]|jgi:uncharacterized protein YggE
MRIATLLLACVLLCGLMARAEEPPRTITMSGESVVYVTPDQAEVTFGIETSDKDRAAASSANEEASGRVFKAIRDLGISADAVTVIPHYTISQRGVMDTFIARRSYTVLLKDLKVLEKLNGAVVEAGANVPPEFQLQSSQLRQHRDEARLMAARAAREKSEALARELGCKLGPPRMVEEGFSGGGGANGAADLTAARGEEITNTPTGRIAITATVNVVFDLIPVPETRK